MKNDFNIILLKNFDLRHTLLGGQAFNFDLINDWYYGFFSDKIIKLKKENDLLYFQTYPQKDDFEFVNKLLRLNVDYDDVIKKISVDNHIKKAIAELPNLRLLKQPFEQTVISYIFSANNNIKNIRNSIRNLCKLNNRSILVDNIKFYFFPTLDEILALNEDKIKHFTRCGFRSCYIYQVAYNLKQCNFDIEKDNKDDIIKRLKTFKGIGNKIADCIAVFALAKDDITPIDIWAKRALNYFYKIPINSSYEYMQKFLYNKFKNYTSYAGQFLFEYIRQKNIKNF